MGADQKTPSKENFLSKGWSVAEYEDCFEDSEEWNESESNLDDLDDFTKEDDDETVDQRFYIHRDQVQTPEWIYPYFFVTRNGKIFLLERLFKDEKGIYFLMRDVRDIIQTRGAYEDSHPHGCQDCGERFTNERQRIYHTQENHNHSYTHYPDAGRRGRSKEFTMPSVDNSSYSSGPDSDSRHGSH